GPGGSRRREGRRPRRRADPAGPGPRRGRIAEGPGSGRGPGDGEEGRSLAEVQRGGRAPDPGTPAPRDREGRGRAALQGRPHHHGQHRRQRGRGDFEAHRRGREGHRRGPAGPGVPDRAEGRSAPRAPPAGQRDAATNHRGSGRTRAPGPDQEVVLRVVYESLQPYEDARIHAAAVYCSDGRIGEQIDDFLHNGLGLPRYDRVAVPGGPACLSGRLMAFWEARGVEDQLRFLARVHGLSRVVLIAHEGCAYYAQRLGIPAAAAPAAQREDLFRASRLVESLAGVRAEPYVARLAGAVVRFEALDHKAG